MERACRDHLAVPEELDAEAIDDGHEALGVRRIAGEAPRKTFADFTTLGSVHHAQGPRATLTTMSTIRARVRDGRLIVGDPTDLPEGTELDLVIDDAGDSLHEVERAALNAAIALAWASFQAGEGRLAADVLADLAKR